MRPVSGITAALLITTAASGACHHSARAVGAPLPVDTLDNGYTISVREHPSDAARSIGPAEIARLRVKRVEELLAGRLSGVHVLPTRSGGFTVRVRGVTTINGHAEPLYIIDGVPTTVAPDEGLNWLDPADILRIEVLKDPADTSVYGAAGANGVIVIRTIRGTR